MALAPAFIPKLTIIFPGGDQITSVLIAKEKDTVISDLIQRLCTLRALDVKSLKAKDDVGKKVNVAQTVGESNLVFIELIDKNEKKTKKKEETPKKVEQPGTKLRKGKRDDVILTLGENCEVPIKDQLFEEELQALHDYRNQYENSKFYSDEFLIACLFTKKLDLKRTAELVDNNLKWRRANGFMNLPTLSDLGDTIDQMTMNFQIPGARDKTGCGIAYMIMGDDMQIGKEPFTINTMKKWLAWLYFVGIFHDGVDYLRNGVTMIEDLTGYGWKHFDVDFQKQMSAMWVDTFPLRVKRILVLNPPMIFGAIIKICKTFMKVKMLERLEVVEKQKDLKKWVDDDKLPTFFSGTSTFDHAQWVKKLREFAEKNEERLIAPGRDMK